MILANYTSIWYNFNAKTTKGTITKYVYGLGLIGEEKCDEFKTYHFDYRGSTIAITDSYGYVIDTVVLDKFSRYISGKTSGLDGSEEISIFLGAFYWKHSENYFTGEWSTGGSFTYENPWDKQIVLIQH